MADLMQFWSAAVVRHAKGSYALFRTWNPFKYSFELPITLLMHILCLRTNIHTMKHILGYVLQPSTAPSLWQPNLKNRHRL